MHGKLKTIDIMPNMQRHGAVTVIAIAVLTAVAYVALSHDLSSIPRVELLAFALFWALMIGETASGVVAVIRRKQQRRHRLAHGLCLTCGYSLAGNISGVCPECGTPVIDT